MLFKKPIIIIRARAGAMLSALMKMTFQRAENGRPNNLFSESDMPPPVFILGHWRSGTTYLHNLLANDPQFGALTNAQAFFPWSLDSGKKLAHTLAKMVFPKTRWDGVPLLPGSPQEEEFALQRLFGESAYSGWHCPSRAERLFHKYCLLEFDHKKERKAFERNYCFFIKKLSQAYPGKTLLLKNPPNTGRVPMLLGLFPGAKFIYLHRRADHVLLSTRRMHEWLYGRFSVEGDENADPAPFIQSFHRELLAKYGQDKRLIPVGQLIEIEYAHFTQNPMQTAMNIYRELQLPGWEKAAPAFSSFIKKQRGHQPFRYGNHLSSSSEASALSYDTNH